MNSLEKLQNLDPYEFEELIADVWNAKGYDTHVRKKSNDRGVDVEARKNGYLEVIQAKRYADSNKIGSQTVRNYATLYQQIPEADAIVIVTSGEFTNAARELASDLDVDTFNGREFLGEMNKYSIELTTKISYQKSSISSTNKQKTNFSRNPSPFDKESKYIKISSNQGYIDACQECGEESVWYAQRSYDGEKYNYLKCSNCNSVWINSQTPPGRSLDDWTRVDAEDDLRDGGFRKKIKQETSGRPQSGDCFIATAAYGTPHAREIDTLRLFRDEILLQNLIGKAFVSLYYQYSPPIASWISQEEWRKEIIRYFIISPSVLFSQYILSQMDTDDN